MESSLIKHINQYIPLTLEEEAIILDAFQRKHVPKKNFVLRAGNICNFEAYVLSGCFRLFYLDEKGVEHTFYFAVEDWWLADLDSYNNQKASNINIEALEDSEILWIPKSRKEELYTEISGFEKMFRMMTQKQCIALQRRVIQGLSQSAEDRYLDFCQRYPHIRARLSNIQLAAYLGITHEFLSKIKKRTGI